MSGQPWWAIPDWWAAIGTITAVVYAIFHEAILVRWTRPKLKMSITVGPPDCVKTAFSSHQTGEHIADCYYFRLRVKNEGHRTAENVEVYAERLQRRFEDGNFRDVDRFPPMDLLWSHVRRSTQSVSPRLPRHCDLAFVAKPRNWEDAVDAALEDAAKLCFDLEVKPNQGGYEIGAGAYRLTVALGASNVAASKKDIDIRFEGQWYEDETEMFSRGIRFEVAD